MYIPKEGIRIDLPFIALAEGKRDNPSLKEAYLTLFEKHITYKIIANYDSNSNPEEVSKSYKCNNRRGWMRSDITQVEMFKDNGHNTWAVGIKFGDDGPEWDFIEPDEARKLYETLLEYMVTR